MFVSFSVVLELLERSRRSRDLREPLFSKVGVSLRREHDFRNPLRSSRQKSFYGFPPRTFLPLQVRSFRSGFRFAVRDQQSAWRLSSLSLPVIRQPPAGHQRRSNMTCNVQRLWKVFTVSSGLNKVAHSSVYNDVNSLFRQVETLVTGR